MEANLLTAWGLNHRTAPLAVRERLAFLPEQLNHSLAQLARAAEVQEVAILSTCHRTEVYCVGTGAVQIPAWLAAERALPMAELQPHLYQHQHQAGYQHLLRVACGLDSAILGETQILGQVKQAYQVAQQAGTIGSHLRHVFESIFTWSKRVRAETAVSAKPVTLAYSAWLLIKQLFAKPADLRVLMVGAGAVSTLIMRYLQQQGVAQIQIANRSVCKAERWGQAINLSQVASALADSDVVLCALGGGDWQLTYEQVAHAQAKRRGRPLCLIDLSMPRRMAARAHDLPDVFLYNIDDLARMVAAGRRARLQAADDAEQVIASAVQSYQQQEQRVLAKAVVQAFRRHAERLAEQELSKAQAALARGEAATTVLARYHRRLLQQWLHRPTTQIHNLDPDQPAILDALVHLFAET